MFTLIYLIMITSLIIISSSHPVSILACILIQTLLICTLLWNFIKSSWFSFILFLIFLGGLMVLFVYVVSLASNEKFELNLEQTKKSSMFFFIIALISFFIFYFSAMKNANLNLFSFKTMMIFSESTILTTSLIMIYLFFTLLVAVKISSKFEGPLRNTN